MDKVFDFVKLFTKNSMQKLNSLRTPLRDATTTLVPLFIATRWPIVFIHKRQSAEKGEQMSMPVDVFKVISA